MGLAYLKKMNKRKVLPEEKHYKSRGIRTDALSGDVKGWDHPFNCIWNWSHQNKGKFNNLLTFQLISGDSKFSKE
jgi:hypothetical protein